MNATEYLLKLLSWQWFGTLTFSDDRMGTARSRHKRTMKFLSSWAATEHLSLAEMPLVIRWELGYIGDRPHCHFLISGFHPRSVTKSNGHRKNAYWFRHNGIARIRPWDASQREQNAEYLTKGLEREDTEKAWREGANANELSRFNPRYLDRLCLNGACWSALQRITGTSFDVARCT